MPDSIFTLSEVVRRDERVDITSMRELDEHEYRQLAESAVAVQRLAPSATFDLISRNIETLDGLQQLLARRAASAEEGTFHLSQGHFFRLILAALANYLSSGRMHTDSTMDVLSATYGKDSHLYKEAKSDWCELFDSNPGYRFTYHLRNALQHIGTLSLSWRSVISDDPDERVQIYSDRDKLLKAYDWHKTVRRDLLEGPQGVVFLPKLIEGYAGYVWHEQRRIRRAIIAEHHHVEALHSALDSLPEHSGAVILAEMKRVDGRPGTVAELNSMAMPPPEMLRAMLESSVEDGFDGVMPRGYSRTSIEHNEPDKLRLSLALDLLDAAHSSGPAGITRAVQDVVRAGPDAAAATMISLVNTNMLSLTQLQMLHGQDIGSMLSGLRSVPPEPA